MGFHSASRKRQPEFQCIFYGQAYLECPILMEMATTLEQRQEKKPWHALSQGQMGYNEIH
jgi:hypothetical protein